MIHFRLRRSISPFSYCFSIIMDIYAQNAAFIPVSVIKNTKYDIDKSVQIVNNTHDFRGEGGDR
jgi:hypothetical protein